MGKFRRISTELWPLIDVRHWFSLDLSFLYRFSSNLVKELILGRSVLGSQMGKFQQISTELWPLIDIRNKFLLSIFGISLPIFFKLCMRVDIGKECLGIASCRWMNFIK